MKTFLVIAIPICLIWAMMFALPYLDHHKLVIINTDRANSGDCEGEVQKRLKPYLK